MQNKGFEGWYYKHQRGEDMIAFIPGRAQSGAFVQMMTSHGARQFEVPELSVLGNRVWAGNCFFSPKGCRIDLPGVQGEIVYGETVPLSKDIMGPFRFLPMECRHGVVSMAHPLRGSVTVDGVRHSFDGGIGYAEKDSGISFPRAYQWLQCNDFPEPCALMVAVASIPFGKIRFKGCIGSVIYDKKEYRFATYRGVKIRSAQEREICLSQGKYLLHLEIGPGKNGHFLSAPRKGRMTGVIRESANVGVRARLYRKETLIFDLQSNHAAYEYVSALTDEG